MCSGKGPGEGVMGKGALSLKVYLLPYNLHRADSNASTIESASICHRFARQYMTKAVLNSPCNYELRCRMVGSG